MPTTPVPDVDRLELATSVDRLFGLLRRITVSPEVSLTAASTLATLDRGGPRRLTELAAGEGVTQPAMTQLVSRLERDGLGRRATDPADGRVVLVEITEAGRELLRHRRAGRAARLAELLGQLSPADQAAIAAAAPALARLVELAPPA